MLASVPRRAEDCPLGLAVGAVENPEEVIMTNCAGSANLRLKPALRAQSPFAILRNILKEVLASTVYAASVAMANGWRAI